MRDFARKVRNEAVRKAPAAWAAEYGKDIFHSLPRLAAGVVAFNLPGFFQHAMHNGMTSEGIENVFGRTLQERFQNVLMAAYFTKTPYSFQEFYPNYKAQPITGRFGRLVGGIFERGDVKRFYGMKQDQLRKSQGVLDIFGAKYETLNETILKHYRPSSSGLNDIRVNEVINQALETTTEFAEIKTILEPYQQGRNVVKNIDPKTGQIEIYDLTTGFNKEMSNKGLDENGKPDEVYIKEQNENLTIAKKIIDTYNAFASKKIELDNLSPSEAFEIVTKLKNVKFDGNALEWGPTLPETIKDFTSNAIDKNTRRPIAIMRDYLVRVFEEFGLSQHIKIDGEKLIAPDITQSVEFGEGNTKAQIAFNSIFEAGVKAGWIKTDTMSPSKININDNMKATVKDIYDSSVKNMMDEVWGSNWAENNILLDDGILSNPSWHRAFGDLNQRWQNKNVYSLLTGSGHHDIDGNVATLIKDDIAKLIKYKNKIRINSDELDNMSSKESQELIEFVNRLHKIVKLTNPGITKVQADDIDVESLRALKQNIEKAVGDSFKNYNSWKSIEQHVVNEALHKLGINTLHTGFDVQTSLVRLMENEVFNTGQDGRFKFPDLENVTNSIKALDSKIAPDEMKDTIIKHYEEVYMAIKESNYGLIEFDPTIAEAKDGDWFSSLKSSYYYGKNVMSELSLHKLNDLKTQMEMLGNASLTMAKNIELGASNIKDSSKKDSMKKMEALHMQRKATFDLLVGTIKDALDSSQ